MLSLKIGDMVSNKAGDNKGRVLGIAESLRPPGSRKMMWESEKETLIAVRWDHRGEPEPFCPRSVVWYSLDDMERVGMRKVEEKASISCGKCGQVLPEEAWPMPRLK